MSDEFNPADHTAQEVKDHLAAADPEEFARVIGAERDGKGRVSVLNFTQDMAEGTGTLGPDGYTRVVVAS